MQQQGAEQGTAVLSWALRSSIRGVVKVLRAEHA